MKKTTLLVLAIMGLSTVTLFAQDEDSFSFSGSVDTYYRYNFNSFNRVVDNGIVSPVTSFAARPGFSIGMVNLIAAYEGEKVGFVADLVYGPRGEAAVFNSVGSSSIVNQLYVYYNVSDAVTLTMGNFNTFLGYEVISPTGNYNYSTSYMFSYGPFSHTGLKADFALSDGFSAMLAIMNPTDLTEFNNVGTYTLGAQLGYDNEGTIAYLNFLYGDQDGKLVAEFPTVFGDASTGPTFQADLTAGFDLTDAFYLGINTTINTTSAGEEINGNDIEDADGDASGFYGAALYAQYATSETLSFGIRAEYFGEFNGGYGILGQYNAGLYDEDGNASVIDLTLSSNIAVGNLTFIPEIRIDAVSDDAFINRDIEAQSSLASFILAAVYAF
uniref:Porin n=1 Tax=Roseihalotalea indica TaxID=2867963 RepID=A0AA49JGI5_9BACT|nr:porin [Tunicatimonas sp. TK19036]